MAAKTVELGGHYYVCIVLLIQSVKIIKKLKIITD